VAQRIIVALVYAIGVVSAAYQATTPPISVEGWVGLGISFVVAFWGKFSSSQTVVAMNRTVWTDTQRKAAELGEINK